VISNEGKTMKKNAIKLLVSLPMFAGLMVGLCSQAHAVTFAKGDVFAAIGNGMVSEYTPTGTLVQTLNTGLGGLTTGMAFDSSGNLYVTDFDVGKISKFDKNGNQVNGSFVTGLNNPESIVFDKSGNFYVGDAGSDLIRKFNPSGTLLASYTVARENRGTDWIDLSADGKTAYYTSEGTHVKVSDLAGNKQLPDFATLGGSVAYALRLLPGGGALVADTENVARLDSSGNTTQTYNAPGENTWFSLNLDPNGTSFWSGNFGTGNIYEFNIGGGPPIQTIPTGSSSLFGVAVFGEVTVVHPTPDPGPGLPVTVVCVTGLLVAHALLRRSVAA
jgi:hypothetical protein